MKKVLLVVFLGIGILSNLNAISASGIKVALKNCNNNIGKDCATMGAVYAAGLGGVNPDMEKAKYFWKKGCMELDNASSCVTYANTLTDINDKLLILEKSCKLGNENGCLALKSMKKMITNENNCNSGNANACKKVSLILLENFQFDLAKNFLQLSCKSGDKKSCEDIDKLSIADYSTLNIIQDTKEICYSGDREACFSTGTYYLGLMRIVKDKGEILSSIMTASFLYKKGCKLGKKEACKIADNIEGVLNGQK